MKNGMKLFAVVAMIVAGGVLAAEPPEVAWRTDFDAALTDASAQGRAVLLDFTGSDWCVWCHRLDVEVFDKEAFADYAREHLILVQLDFPNKKELPAELKAQNDALAERFGVTGYPTVVLLDGSGAEIGRLGYMQGGAKTFVRALKKFVADAAARSGGSS